MRAPGNGLWLGAALLLAVVFSSSAQAQVQRTLINLGFERPALGAPACFRFISESVVPGWTTDHPVIVTQTLDCTNATIPGAPASGPALEFWTNGFNATPPRNGAQHVELNASASSRLSQSVCLINGEQVSWVFSHRGRGSPTVQDVMSYLVGPAQIVRVGTTNAGTGGVLVTSQGTATSAAGPNGWRDYSGAFTYTGATGTSNMGFQSISTGSGNNTIGNFLDDIQITLRPFVEFVQPANTKAEATAASTADIPRIRVTGTVPAGGMTVVVNITGGTATLGSDYTTPGNSTTLSIAVPAGAYDGDAASEFVLPVTLVSDAVAEPSETISFTLPTPVAMPRPYLLASTITCGAAGLINNTLTITDATAQVSLLKSVASRPTGGSSGFTVRIEQDASLLASASTGLGSGTANGSANTGARVVTAGVPVTLSEVLQAGSTHGLSQFDASIACANANGSSSTALPGGLAAGGSWTFTPALNDQITCTITNTAAAPAPAQLTVSKSDGLANYRPGGSASYVIVVNNAGSGPAMGASLSDPLPAGVTLSGPWTCSASAGSSCPASGGAAGGSAVNLTINVLAGGSVTITVPVSFSANPGDY
ncbi:hypothetical protein [Arenimonas alkanexedens]